MPDRSSAATGINRMTAGLFIPAMAMMAMAGISSALAQHYDGWDIDGAHGTLQISGSLTESTCRLEMTSLRQDVQLGNIDTARLQRPGDSGAPVTFQLRLKECVRGPAFLRDPYTGVAVTSSLQPAVSVLFSGTRDDDLPDDLKAQGASGLALRLSDSHGRRLPLNARARPLLLSPGQDRLTYTITPVRTPAPLRAGAFQASIDFRMIYD